MAIEQAKASFGGSSKWTPLDASSSPLKKGPGRKNRALLDKRAREKKNQRSGVRAKHPTYTGEMKGESKGKITRPTSSNVYRDTKQGKKEVDTGIDRTLVYNKDRAAQHKKK